jgi:hypothetical protein
MSADAQIRSKFNIDSLLERKQLQLLKHDVAALTSPVDTPVKAECVEKSSSPPEPPSHSPARTVGNGDSDPPKAHSIESLLMSNMNNLLMAQQQHNST